MGLLRFSEITPDNPKAKNLKVKIYMIERETRVFKANH